MKINIDDIPEGGLSLDISEDGRKIEELAGKLDFSFLSPVDAHMELTKAEGNVYVTGRIKARLGLNCSRCLNEYPHELEADFSIFYSRAREEEREKELKPEDMEVNYLEGPEIDTNDILLSQLSLEAPMQPLCKADCKGLCPRCGADLNLGDCGCGGKEKTDPRFAKLKDFKVK